MIVRGPDDAGRRRSWRGERLLLEAFALGVPWLAWLFHQAAGGPGPLQAAVERSFVPFELLYTASFLTLALARFLGRPPAELARPSLGAWRGALLAMAVPGLLLAGWELASPRPHEGVRFGLLWVSLLPCLALALWAVAPPSFHRALRPEAVALALIPSLLLLAAVESGWRHLGTPPTRGMPSVTSPDRSYWTYQPGNVASREGVVHRFNSWGFRGPEPGGEEQGKSVLVLGDSIPFGGGIPEERVFPWLAERLLRDAGRIPEAVTVMNASLPGFATEQIRTFYVEHLAGLPHDQVVLVQYIDDVNRELHYKKDDLIYTPAWPEWMQDGVHGIRIWKAVLTLLGFREAEFDVFRRRSRREAWPRALALIEEIRAVATRRGAGFAIFDVPRFKWPATLRATDEYGALEFNRELAAWCRERDVPYRDLLPVLVGRDIRPLRMSAGDVHLNVRGHAVVAREFAAFLEELLAGRS